MKYCSHIVQVTDLNYTLVLDRKAYLKEMRKIGKESFPEFGPSSEANATTHFISSKLGQFAFVFLNLEKFKKDNYAEVAVASIIVHEAVHIWQYTCEMIGEDKPGVEQEAYAIQYISQELFLQYRRHLETQK